MINRVQVSALILVPLISVATTLLLVGENLTWWKWVAAYGSAVSATVGALHLFDRWVWKWSLLHGWFVERPVLADKWTFTIKPLWTDPKTGNRQEPINAEVTIRQTYTQLHLRLETPESSGDLIASKIVTKNDGTYQVVGVFRNEPSISIQDRSRIHLGAFVLDVSGESPEPTKLTGQYWTDRGTAGEIHGNRL